MELVHPTSGERVQAWISADYFFPLKVRWFRKDETTAWRGFEFTDFKKRGELWFPVGLRLHGENWRGQIIFDDADAALVSDRPAPADLFAPEK